MGMWSRTSKTVVNVEGKNNVPTRRQVNPFSFAFISLKGDSLADESFHLGQFRHPDQLPDTQP